MISLDYTLDKIIKEIQEEIKVETGREISYDTCVKIINHQIDSTVKGMSKGYTIVWKYFGTFVATQKRVDMLNKTYISKGKTPTLEDKGFMRISFNRKGDIKEESKFDHNSVKDLIYPNKKDA